MVLLMDVFIDTRVMQQSGKEYEIISLQKFNMKNIILFLINFKAAAVKVVNTKLNLMKSEYGYL